MLNEFTIGRLPDNSLCIQDNHVSRHHAKFVKTPSGLEIVDLNSAGGTFVNGRRITRARVNVGDDVRFSQHHRFNWGSFTFTNWNNSGSGFSSTPSSAGMPFVIGRDEHCNLRINHPFVSRNHARLTNTVQGLLIEDLGSSGGTAVRGVKVTRTAVTPGDSVVFSDKVRLDWNVQPLRAWLNGGIQPNGFQQQQNYRAPAPAKEHAYSYQPPAQKTQNSAVRIAGSIAAVFLIAFGVLIATDTISLSDRSAEAQSSNCNFTVTPPPTYSSYSNTSGSNSGSSSTSGSSNVSHTSSSSNSSGSNGGVRYSGVQEGSSSHSSGNSHTSSSSGTSDLGLAVEYGTAIYQGDAIGLVQLEMETHGGQRALEATGRMVDDAADGRYGETVQNATRAIDGFANDLTDNLTSGLMGGW